MLRRDDYLHEAPYQSKAFDMYFRASRCAVLDIETTGLRPYQDQAVLIGFVLPELDADGRPVLHAIQLFAESLEEEAELLREADAIMKTVDCVITFNGRRFDLPFLKTRAKKNHLTIADPYDLDLYQVIRHYSPLPTVLPSLRQKSIEVYMGLSDDRADEIDGGESVRLYYQYLNTREDSLLERILLHNHDDILQLARLLRVIENCDLHRAIFNLGIPAGGLTTAKIKANAHGIAASVKSSLPIGDAVVFPSSDRPYRLTASAKTKEAELEFYPEHPAEGVAVLDAASLLGCGSSGEFEQNFSLARLPGVQSGYLVYAHSGRINYLGINGFLLEFLKTLPPLLHLRR